MKSDNKNYIMSPYIGKISKILLREQAVIEMGDVLLLIQITDANYELYKSKKVSTHVLTVLIFCAITQLRLLLYM